MTWVGIEQGDTPFKAWISGMLCGLFILFQDKIVEWAHHLYNKDKGSNDKR